MIYELRIYEVVPGKMDELNDAYRNHFAELMEKNGMKIIGFWETVIGTGNVLYYMLAFKDMAQREEAWKRHQEDPEMIRLNEERKKSGKYYSWMVRTTNVILKPTDYSPLQ